MTSVGPPQFDFDTHTSAVPNPPPAPARNGLVAALGIGLVVAIVGIVAVFWGPADDPAPGSAEPAMSESVPDRSTNVADEDLEAVVPRYEFNVAGIAVHGMTPTGDGYMAFAAGSDPGTLVRLTSRDGRRWDRDQGDPFVDATPGLNPVGVWRTPDGHYLGAFATGMGRNLTMSLSADGISWTPLTSFEGDGLMLPSVVAVNSHSALVTITETTGGPPRVADQVTVDLTTGMVEPLALGLGTDIAGPFEADDAGRVTRLVDPTESPVVVRSAVADPATGGFMVVTENTAEAAAEGSRHQIRRILPDGRSFPFVRPHPGPSSSSSPTLMSVIGLVEELGVVDGDVVIFTSDLVFRVDSETSGWDTPTTFRSDSSVRKYVDVITGAGGAAVLLAETDPDLDGQATIVVSRDAVDWTDVVIAERLSNPQLRALGDDEVVIEGFRIGVGTIRVAIPLDQ